MDQAEIAGTLVSGPSARVRSRRASRGATRGITGFTRPVGATRQTWLYMGAEIDGRAC